MNYRGAIIEESLGNTAVLEKVKIISTKIEEVTSKHKTPWLNEWRLHTVEIPENQADEIAEEISSSIEREHSAWYADYKNNKYHYIIFPNRIFKIDLSNPQLYKEAKQYGISLGIPEYQVDFAPADKVWDR